MTRDNNKDLSLIQIRVKQEPKNPSALAFAGQWLDRETGLYYQINRYRLQDSDKFISPDPIGFTGGDNLYAYANSNPLQWHDPDGLFAHWFVGGAIGGGFGALSYLAETWWTGADFDWGEFGIRTGAGVVAGAVSAATFGVVNPFLASQSLNATVQALGFSSATGIAGGFSYSLIDSVFRGNSLADSLKAGGYGAINGGVAGLISGGLLSQLGGSFGATMVSGAIGGGTMNGANTALSTYLETGDISESLYAGTVGFGKGFAVGGAVSGLAWGAGYATGKIQKLEGYPEDLPNPRKGLMIKTKVIRDDYAGMPTKEGHARHHIKPLSLGGRDVKSNLEYVPTKIHNQSHPGAQVRNAKMGTIFF